jgi:hypothetical protein
MAALWKVDRSLYRPELGPNPGIAYPIKSALSGQTGHLALRPQELVCEAPFACFEIFAIRLLRQPSDSLTTTHTLVLQ